ncbi:MULTISPECIES: carbohydrate ABC transporter permease [unclassified Herbiconiux]|uniref:carbohydrate ABC transporter permease n=1 Tax=unclassified Herbiconiux TaxID=2618217 RepID=UPI0015642D2A|nr:MULTISPECIES: sugar ABC transporter permease [unclassified Herbiconiux]MBF4574322.1 sugar ABC transporter permease [Herbiconiux sp. VKM Ac-1786]NQX36913.1 sugar ABC transporter permease [Herbiconiux sp. VKM Ac-2851]
MSVSAAARPRRRRSIRRGWIGWLFVAPFGIVFLVFLVAPLAYAFYLSLFSKGLATGTVFSGAGNYVKAFTDPEFLSGLWFVLRFAVVLIPLQMAVSLAAALVLDSLTTRLSRFSRLAIFVPYAIPAVIGTLMWGFLYSPVFGPLTGIFGAINQSAPDILSADNIFGGLLNVVVWQWAGYYMIIIYAALQGIDPSIYEAARIDGATPRQIAFRVKIPMISSAMVLILVFALIGTLQFFTEPQVLKPIANGAITASFTPNIYAYNLAFQFSQFNYASTISFALGIVVFIAVYIFLFSTRKRRGGFSS